MSRSISSTTRRLGVAAALALALAVAGPLASVAAAAPRAAKATSIATLKIMNPSVSVKVKGKKQFKPATDGQQLHEGDVVQTDTTGLAEVDYSDDSYTRLDVSTTLKIVKLSDDQGNRQVNTSVDVGRTWNRTAELTESQSFEQSGAGATAAVVGTAFAVECDTPAAPATVANHCVTIGVIHTTEWTGADGTKLDLGPYETCDATDGVICDEPTQIAAFDEWIQRNLYLDFVLRGLSGPISGVVSFENGHVTFTPTTTLPASTPLDVLDANSIGCLGGCSQSSNTGGQLAPLSAGFTPGTSIVIDTGIDQIMFQANLGTVDPSPYFVVFDSVSDPSVGTMVGYCNTSGCPTAVTMGSKWAASTIFGFLGIGVPGTTSFSFHIEDQGGNTVSRTATVPIQVNDVCCGGGDLRTPAPAGTVTTTPTTIAPGTAGPQPPHQHDPPPSTDPTTDPTGG